MKPVINESQKREIGALAVEHSDALIAMGADLYRQGLIKGASLVWYRTAGKGLAYD